MMIAPSDGTLVLVPPHLDLVEDFHAALIESYEDHKEYLPWAQPNPDIEMTRGNMEAAARDFAELKNELRFIVKRRSDDKIVGCVGLHLRDMSIPYVEVGYWTRTSEVGKNYCTAAVRLVERYAVTELKVRRVEIRTAVSNTASARVAQKAGYILEATTQDDRTLTSGLLDGTHIFAKVLSQAHTDKE